MKRYLGMAFISGELSSFHDFKTSTSPRWSGFHQWFRVCLTAGMIATGFSLVQADDSNTFYGGGAGEGVTGIDDSAFGYAVFNSPLNPSRSWCTAAGANSLRFSSGSNCTAVGKSATEYGYDNTGYDNTTIGADTGIIIWYPDLYVSEATAIGYFALGATVGSEDTVTGNGAVNETDGGQDNTGNGYLACNVDGQGLFPGNSYGTNNTATGALTIGVSTYSIVGEPRTSENTANGVGALQNATGGSGNTAIGVGTLYG